MNSARISKLLGDQFEDFKKPNLSEESKDDEDLVNYESNYCYLDFDEKNDTKMRSLSPCTNFLDPAEVRLIILDRHITTILKSFFLQYKEYKAKFCIFFNLHKHLVFYIN